MTGWPPPELAQDDCRHLFRWFASKPDARRLVRERCEHIRREQMTPTTGAAELPEALTEDQWLDLAQRHVMADWNSDEPDGYLNAIKAVCVDYAAQVTALSAAQAGVPADAVGWIDDGGTLFWKGNPLPDGSDIYAAPQPSPSPAPAHPGQEGEREYPPLPEPAATGLGDEYESFDRNGKAMGKAYETILYFKPDQMRAYVDADRASRAAPQPATADAVPSPGERCKWCADRHDGFYGSYAPECPHHDDDGKSRATHQVDQK